MDDEAAAENLRLLREATDLPIYPVCAVLGDGLQPVLAKLRELVPTKAR
jgi:hypothetical protein